LLYESQGKYAKAEPMHLEARDIRKRVLGVEHPLYATSLNNLALLYKSQGESEKAEPLFLEARDITKRVLGVEHSSYATSLNNLASVYDDLGQYEKAEPLYLEARDIWKRVLGVEHPSYAASLNNLAVLYKSQGEYAKAEPLYLEARDIFKRVLGVEHPSYAESLGNLAGLYESQGEYAKAELLFRESLKLSRGLIERNAVGQSQSTQLKYAAMLRSRLDDLLSHGLTSSTAGTGLFDEILSWKGMTLVRQRKYRLAGEDARTRPILESLTAASRRLTAVLRKTPTPNTQKAWRQQVADLSEKRDRLEAELAAASPEIQQASERLTTEDLLETLPEDTVLVDFLSFNFWQRVPKEDYHVLESEQHVLASILRKGRPVEFVNLGPEADINKAVKQWRTVFLSRNPNDAVGVEPAGRKLRQQIWKPLLPHLQDARTVILCPDGALGRVAFVALPGREKGSYLIEDHRLACVPVPQLLPALFRKASAEQRPAGDVLLIGDVDYSADTKEQAAPKKRKRRRGSEELFRDVAFGPLDETAGEIAAIRDLFFELFDAEPDAVRTLRKQQATESAFRQYAGKYETLHIATHGFFADASKKSAEQSAAAETRAGSRSGLFGQNDNAMTHVTGFHPGMLSGLALAGANHAPEADGDDDGILTADEISFLRLEGVDLVVLSACETGLGEVAGGEGLLGVQRAFQVSGARSVLASLWSVDDVATRRLMDRFYRNLWNKKMTRLDALREAQLWMLKNPGSIEGSIVRGSLVRLKKPPKDTSPKPENATARTNPRFWAAFTLSGDWR
jgi:CHAT domain-containing protein